LARTYDENDYKTAIIVVALRHEERERDIEHKKKFDLALSKKANNKGLDCSKPESLNHRGDRKKPYDNGKKKT
jgi:hypothetical protein